MSDRMRIRPRPELVGTRGDYGLSADGEEVPRSRFWLRRVRAGDVLRVEAKTQGAPATKAGKEPVKEPAKGDGKGDDR